MNNKIVQNIDNDAAFAGIFKSEINSDYYLLFVNKNRKSSETFNVTLNKNILQKISTKGIKLANLKTSEKIIIEGNNPTFSISVKPGDGQFYHIEK